MKRGFILILGILMLLSCSQNRFEEQLNTETVELVETEHKTYIWQENNEEAIKDLTEEDNDSVLQLLDGTVVHYNYTDISDEKTFTKSDGSYDFTTNSEVAKSEKDFLLSYSKQKIEDFIDLTAIYTNENTNLELKNAVEESLMEYLNEEDFKQFVNHYSLPKESIEKIEIWKLKEIKDGSKKGKFKIITKSKNYLGFFKIIETKTDLGISRKFSINIY